MSKIRLLAQGWENYTGYLGPNEFKDGVSVEALSTREAARLGCIMLTERVDDGVDPSACNQEQYRRAGNAIPDPSDPVQASLPPLETPVVEQGAPAPAPARFERAALEAIADQKGIKGLRELADPMGIKANSIGELINRLLQAYGTETPAPEQAVEQAAVPPEAQVEAPGAEQAPAAAPEQVEGEPAAEDAPQA